MYTTSGFLEKNAEKMPYGVSTLLADSKLNLLRIFGNDIGAEEAAQLAAQKGGAKKSKPVSAAGTFRASIRQLNSKISSSERHYVRCVKPNAAKVPGRFTSQSCMEQLQYSGILEAVHIRQQGFSTRMSLQSFIQLIGASCIRCRGSREQ
jgi:myosin heavy subunit